MKVLLATPCSGGFVHYKFMDSVLTQIFLHPARLASQARYDFAMYTAASHSGLAKDRGVIASFALRENFDKLLFIDSDQSFTWESVKALLDSQRSIVAGMVAMKKYPLQLNFHPTPENRRFFEAEKGAVTPDGVKQWRSYHVAGITRSLGEDEMPVSAAGTGFLCIDVKVLRDMVTKNVAEPFVVPEVRNEVETKTHCWDFFSTGVIDGIHYGEDYGFAILAQRAGHRVYVNTSISADHHGMHTYSVPPETWEDQTAGQQQIHFNHPHFEPLSNPSHPLADACEK